MRCVTNDDRRAARRSSPRRPSSRAPQVARAPTAMLSVSGAREAARLARARQRQQHQRARSPGTTSAMPPISDRRRGDERMARSPARAPHESARRTRAAASRPRPPPRAPPTSTSSGIHRTPASTYASLQHRAACAASTGGARRSARRAGRKRDHRQHGERHDVPRVHPGDRHEAMLPAGRAAPRWSPCSPWFVLGDPTVDRACPSARAVRARRRGPPGSTARAASPSCSAIGEVLRVRRRDPHEAPPRRELAREVRQRRRRAARPRRAGRGCRAAGS